MIHFAVTLLLFGISAAQSIRICIVETTKPVPFDLNGAFILRSEEGKYQLTSLNEPLQIIPNDSTFDIVGSGQYKRSLTFASEVTLTAQKPGATLRINDFEENGIIRIRQNESGAVQVIVSRPMEDYLTYVLPHEIGSTKPEHLEALKAQAVAARTYAYRQIARTQPFDVYADVRDQVYQSGETPHESFVNAVKATQWQVLAHDMSIIDIKYCANLGGYQERPAYEVDAHQPLMKPKGKPVLGKKSRHWRWTIYFTLDELVDRAQKMYGQTFGDIDVTQGADLQLAIRSRTPVGRVDTLDLTVNNITASLTGFEIRRFFSKDGKTLPSNLFYMKNGNSTLMIHGGGYGHGDGMGQWEAMELSEQGYNYQQILKFFYPETDLVRR